MRTERTEHPDGSVSIATIYEPGDPEFREERMREGLRARLAELDSAHENWANLTVAQRWDVMRIVVKATMRLIRLQLRALDAGD